MLRSLRLSLLSGLLTLLLSACSVHPLLSAVEISAPVLKPTGNGETVAVSYQIGRDARVSATIESASGERFVLRANEPRIADTNEPYTLSFDGTVPTSDPELPRRLLPDGTYTIRIEAVSAEQPQDTPPEANAQVQVQIAAGTIQPPRIENARVFPETITPNADAIDDVTEITYRLPVTATVDITLQTPDGQTLPFLTREKEEPAEQRHVWDGKQPNGALLANGVYTYTIRAEDRFGNLAQHVGTIRLSDVGQPEATIISARIAPEHIMLGGQITVTMRVRNTGTVPIRTYGPASGYSFSTDQIFSSVENGRYTAQAGGFWRIGVDWDGNAGGGARRYPYRWAISPRPPDQWRIPGVEDWLMPGEEADVVGVIEVHVRETKMGFYVGLIQDGVGFFQDRTARTIVEVGL